MTTSYRALFVALAFAVMAAACAGSDSTVGPATAQPAIDEPNTQAAAEPTDAPAPTGETNAELDDPADDGLGVGEALSLADRGPFAVGVTTRMLDDRAVEIWYPVDRDTAEGQATDVFDALSAFPEALRAIIPPELSGEYDTLAVRDAAPVVLPDDQGFPVLIYGHGFGGYRQIATHFTTHVASWGFVVVSTDHLERGLAEQTLDLIDAGLFDDTNSRPEAAIDDVRNTIALLGELDADGELAGIMNLDQLAISGHSAGAGAAVQVSAAEPDLIDGWISISGGTRDGLELTQPGMVIIGELDTVVPAERSYDLFDAATASGSDVVLVNIADAGHNSFTDPCRGIRDLGGLGALASLLGDQQTARAEDGCTPNALDPETAQAVVNQATVTWLQQLFELAPPSALSETDLAVTGPLADFQSTN